MSTYLMKKFVTMYKGTMLRDNANDYYYFSDDFYKSIIEDLGDNVTIFYAEYQNNIISMALILHNMNGAHYHLSGSDYNYKHMSSTNQLLYEVSNYLCANNIKSFHMGGGLGGKQDSLYKFKKSFNKSDDLEYHIGQITYNEKIYDWLSDQSESDRNADYFPKYRG